jgi:YHS domain-containing protein
MIAALTGLADDSLTWLISINSIELCHACGGPTGRDVESCKSPARAPICLIERSRHMAQIDIHELSCRVDRGMTSGAATTAIDPVCGMTVAPHTAKHRHTLAGQTYYSCSDKCTEAFIANTSSRGGNPLTQ